MRRTVAFTLAMMASVPALAQVTGSASVMLDTLPDPNPALGRQPVTEMRARLFAERKQDVGAHVRLTLSGFVDGLVADRAVPGTVTDVIVRPVELTADVTYTRFDIRIGASRLAWGRLDEFQPTDVVNPLDLAKFLLEGRSEARMAVGLVRGRVFLPGSSTLEAVVVPAFRAGRFDQLDEPTSPFNVSVDAANIVSGPPNVGAAFRRPTINRDEPDLRWSNFQGGARFTSTVSRVDWGASVYRGFRSFPIVSAAVIPLGVSVAETFPRFTMIGGDFETVRGSWGLRGEVAAFVEDELQSTILPGGVPGKSVEAGVGVDRRAGDYRLAANVLWSWRAMNSSDPSATMLRTDEALHGSDASLVVAADRSFARETRTLRVFAVYDPTDDTAFARVIAAVSLHDNVWLEGSGGVLTGSSPDILGRLSRRDFLYARLKVYF